MYILVSGVRHRTAEIDIRERFAIQESEIDQALQTLFSSPDIIECAILTTCNRTELYLVVKDIRQGLQCVKTFYHLFKQIHLESYRQHTFTLMHEEAISHLFRVTAGLDSLILGEGQVLSQVKEAFSFAQQAKTTGVLLNKLFKTALTVGKRVRTETGLAEKDVSVALAAFYFALNNQQAFLSQPVAIIGGGKMAEILMSRLKQDLSPDLWRQVFIINRSTERLAELSERYGFQGCTWDTLPEIIKGIKTVFVATGAPHVVLGCRDFEGHGEKLVIDIAVPRNVDPRVATLPNVQLINTDDLGYQQGKTGLAGTFDETLQKRTTEILEEECIAFLQWQQALSTVPVLTLLREKIEKIRQNELNSRRDSTPSDLNLVDVISKNVIQKILHGPTVRLKNLQTSQEISQQTEMLSHLFNINTPPHVKPERIKPEVSLTSSQEGAVCFLDFSK